MKQTDDAYWLDILKNRRMPTEDEVYRLSHVLYGHFYNHNRYSDVSGRTTEIVDVMCFWDAKRPYGNKDVEASIAYHLGWDYERRLTSSRMPEFVRIEARKLHELVKNELVEQEEFLEHIKNETL